MRQSHLNEVAISSIYIYINIRFYQIDFKY
jgi:hypothetical protein